MIFFLLPSRSRRRGRHSRHRVAAGFPDGSRCGDHCGRRADRGRLTPIAEGQDIKVFWRGKPIYVSHRTKKQIDEARSVAVSSLPDPQSDESRVKPGPTNGWS